MEWKSIQVCAVSFGDVFSRYHWLIPLEGKKSSSIAAALSTVYKEHRLSRVLLHDQGREFDGAVSNLCKKLGINVIKGRLYHPQSQGKNRTGPPIIVRKRVWDDDPGVIVYLTCAVIGLGGRGEVIHGLKWQPAAPLRADVRSHLSGSSVIQPLAAREEIGTVVFFFF